MVNRSSFKTPLSLSLFLLLIIIAALQLEASVSFHYVNKKMLWYDAQRFCKEKFTDLACDDRTGDLFNECKRNGGWFIWMGLHRDPAGNASVWRWTSTRGDASSDINWAAGYPIDDHNCATVSCKSHKWYSTPECHRHRPFMCFNYNVILVKENKTWEEALEHCRAIGSVDSSQHPHYRDHQYDLVSLQSEGDHRHARDKIQEATTNEVWTALRFLAGQWLWVDGEPQQYQDLPQCPAWGRHCGTLPKNHTGQWQIRDCMERRNFLCIKSKHTEQYAGISGIC